MQFLLQNPVSKIPMGERSPDAQDQGTQNNDTAPYEEVSISPQSIYAELNRNREDEKINEHIYQKLSKPCSDYVIPVYVNEDCPYEEVE